MVAHDASMQPQSATATVTINVIRNRPPQFTQNAYSAQASDQSDVFIPILVASATDPDPAVSVFCSVYN